MAGDTGAKVLLREVPRDETWQAIKKGGTAGIYVAIVGLSWWVKTQPVDDSTNLWMVVDDILWVIQQFNGAAQTASGPKRGLEVDDTDETRPTKTYVVRFFAVRYTYLFLLVFVSPREHLPHPLPQQHGFIFVLSSIPQVSHCSDSYESRSCIA